MSYKKQKQDFDIVRFRRYLAYNYLPEKTVTSNDEIIEEVPLPIVTIYILGFKLENLKRPVVKINREYKDVITNEIITIKEDFVELLTHDSYFIQLRELKTETRNKLERVLQVFNQVYAYGDDHKLKFTGDISDPLLEKMVTRLLRASASDEMRDQMDLEDEIYRVIKRNRKEVEEENKAVAKELEESKAAILEKNEQIELLLKKLKDLEK